MSKWYEKVNKYAYPVYYLYQVEKNFYKLEKDPNAWKARKLLDKSWEWLEDHNKYTSNELYQYYSPEPSLAEIVEAANNDEELEYDSDYGGIGHWITKDENENLWYKIANAAGSVIYCAYKRNNEKGFWEDTDLPPDIMEEYWGSPTKDIDYDPEKSQKLINWLIENYPPGTEEKPVYKKEVLELFK